MGYKTPYICSRFRALFIVRLIKKEVKGSLEKVNCLNFRSCFFELAEKHKKIEKTSEIFCQKEKGYYFCSRF
jgi:hypothetical protein